MAHLILKIPLWVFLMVVIATVFPTPSISLAADASLEEIIDGFETESNGGMQSEEDTAGEPDVLEGFDENETPTADSGSRTAETVSPISLDGYFKLGTTFNFSHDAPGTNETDWRGVSRLRAELQLEMGIKPNSRWQAYVSGKGFFDAAYGINGREDYTSAVLSEYEDELELREAYLQVSPASRLDIKAGRQIVVWGKSDNIRVTDVLNPLDLREPGLTDIEDLRLPVTMTRVDFYTGDWSVTGIALHEVRFNKLPVFGHDFFPGASPLPPEEIPSDGGSNTEWAFSASGVFSGWDIALYYARIFDDSCHFEPLPTGFGVERKHARLSMAGLAWNIALGNWLLKTEAAYFDGLEFFNTPDRDYARIDLLAGLEYTGFRETTISLDAVIRHLDNFSELIKRTPDSAVEDQFQSAVRIEKSYLNDTLSLTILASLYGLAGDDGAFERISAQYDITDAVELSAGVVLYQNGDLPEFQNIGDNDRLFLEIKWSF